MQDNWTKKGRKRKIMKHINGRHGEIEGKMSRSHWRENQSPFRHVAIFKSLLLLASKKNSQKASGIQDLLL